MKRGKFISIAGGAILAAGATSYLLSDKQNIVRADIKSTDGNNPALNTALHQDEKEILFLASLAPSGHNTQPWFVQWLEPYHWVIGSDRTKWLPAVDPTQRETILSIGAFLQNLEYAAAAFGYGCKWNLLAKTPQDERVMEVKLTKTLLSQSFDPKKVITSLKYRRTVRSGFLTEVLRSEDIAELSHSDPAWIHYLPAPSPESQWLNAQTILANRLQAYRDPAQRELADWTRFSSRNAAKYRDGLTTASMEIKGIPGWVVRNFYGKDDVMKKDFRERSIELIEQQVSKSAGWILITSQGNSVETLLETGRRMQRLFLKVREKGIAIHPMTQILEEPATQQPLNQAMGISSPIQFILRTGYIKNYPEPVSLRRPIEGFIRNEA
ncbi:MAG: hypothetical protein MH252_16805 [Thermosynechococcaceae cyanobacterium MS004]|nr:hypothetical protein [Thermosynechococcaceae cyanobacterium MS004]